MQLYLVTYDNGEEYEMNTQKQIAIFESYEKAKEFVLFTGFEETEDKYFFVRKTITSHSWVPFKDYMLIDEFELNVPKDIIE